MIKNKHIIEYLQVLLNKPLSKITPEDLKNIKSIKYSKWDADSNKVYDIREILLFENLNSISIFNSFVTIEDIEIISRLNNLSNITFIHCQFQPGIVFTKLSRIKSLTIQNCYIENYNILSELDKLNNLQIIFPLNDKEIDIKVLSNMSELETLSLEGCIIDDVESLEKLAKLKILSLMYASNIRNLNFLRNIKSLKKVYIEKEYINQGEYGNINVYNSSIDLLIDDKDYSKGFV